METHGMIKNKDAGTVTGRTPYVDRQDEPHNVVRHRVRMRAILAAVMPSAPGDRHAPVRLVTPIRLAVVRHLQNVATGGWIGGLPTSRSGAAPAGERGDHGAVLDVSSDASRWLRPPDLPSGPPSNICRNAGFGDLWTWNFPEPPPL
jgi:hypothetical protein